jgi:glucose/arabinose dehydrogenase
MRTNSLVTSRLIGALSAAGLLVAGLAAFGDQAPEQPRAKTPFSDYRDEKAGVVHKITPADLPRPFETPSAQNNAKIAARPEGAMPQALPGYAVSLYYAEDLRNPRLMRTAPNGDLFVAETGQNRIRVLRGIDANGKAKEVEVFASGLNRPFGIAFYPPGRNPTFVYVGNTDSIVRFPYKNGDLKASAEAKDVVPKGVFPGGGHSTRDVVFSQDGKKMFVGIGSLSNVDDPEVNAAEKDRATVLEFNPDGSGRRVYATGIRNPVGLAIHPRTGEVWVSVNERDALGDNLVPDYITHVEAGGFYGWPYYYIGGNQDPRHEGKKPELKSTVKVPDVLLQPHSASLEMLFYTAKQFPAEHRDSIFSASHGSWNKSIRTGYKVIRTPLKGGKPTGEYQDFLTGFVTPDGQVWGRPVGVAVAADGSLMVSDDGSNSIWRVSYTGKK